MYSGRTDGLRHLRERIAGLDEKVPLLDGRVAPYINLDNAASTPPFLDVLEAVHCFLSYYSSVHRGTGFKSRLSTAAYDGAHDMVARFVGAEPAGTVVIFVKNTTEALNKLAFRYPLTPRSVTVSGASNVTGFVQPVHRLARKAHAIGARIVVDAAQLGAHRRIDVKPDDNREHLDYVVLSAHKMYAPFGTGVLIGRRDTFEHGPPEHRGGGTVDIVTPTEVSWAGLPDREEAGSPNVVGAVAMAVAADMLMRIDMDRVTRHEQMLTAYALEQLRSVPGITLYGETSAARTDDRVGVIPFNLDALPHALVAAILGYEGGIGVRSGCFCAQSYVATLLGREPPALADWQGENPRLTRSTRPGMVRVSLGLYNTREDVDVLVAMLKRIAAGDYRGRYQPVPATGEYRPAGYEDPMPGYFSLTARAPVSSPARGL